MSMGVVSKVKLNSHITDVATSITAGPGHHQRHRIGTFSPDTRRHSDKVHLSVNLMSLLPDYQNLS